ncbi:MAG: PAS domain S-box protein, partial [Bacteroidota bacterium]
LAMIGAVVVPLAILLPLAGWYVAAGFPHQETLDPVYRALRMSLAGAAVVVLGAVALAWVVARRLSRPVAGIVSAMQRAASGATDAVAPESGPREIALIGAEFNRMIAARTRLEAERRDALARAEAHERRLAEIIETIAEGVLILGPDGRYELANRAEEVLLGVPRDRIVGVRYDEVSWRRATIDGCAFDLRDHPFERLRRGEPTVRDQVFQLITPQGRSRVVSVNAAALRDAAGGFDGIAMTGVDITERKSAERRLADVIEALGEGLILIGPDGRYQLANRAEEELLGVTRDRIIGLRYDEVPWRRRTADGASFRVEDHPFARLARGEPSVRDFEMQVVSPGGRARTVLASAMPLYDAAGNFDGAVLTSVDITERNKAERRLREIIETMAEGLFIIDADGRYELLNRAAEEMLGTTRERAVGVRFDRAPWGRRAADGSTYRLEDHAFEQLRRGKPRVRDREIQFVPENAPPRTVSVNAVPLRDAAGNFDGIVATFVDVTERKSAERRLRETIETMAEGLAIIGPDGHYELFNRSGEEMIGYPRERILGVRYDAVPWTRIAADGAPFDTSEHPFERLRRGAAALRDYEYRVVTAKGAVRTVSTNAAALRDAAGNFDGIVATWSDVTDRKNAERRLREIIETMAEAVMIIGADGSYELVNREAEELLRRPRECIVGMRQGDVPWARLALDGRPLRVDELPLERLRRGEPALHGYEFQLVLPSGPTRTILINAGPLRDAAGNFTGAVLTGFDITERKAAERRLAEYSARLGTLSRRVLTVQEEERRAVARELHDELGQVLTAVRLNLQTLRRRSRDPELGPVFEDGLALLETAIAEVRALSTRLRPTILDDLGLEAALRSHLERRSVRAELELDTDIRLPQRRLDPAVETACFRIVQEAMTNAVRHAGASRLAVSLRVEDGALVLAVRDDGQGFDPASAARRAARGESAGLSGMEERAQLAGGRLEMNTAPGRGTEVRVVFPLAEATR